MDGSRASVLRAEWDALSPWGAKRKLHPSLKPQNGTCFPLEGSSGNVIPVLSLRTGRSFPQKAIPESASQFEALERDAVSEWCPKRKSCPRILPQSGTPFPDGTICGNCVPEHRRRQH